MKIKIYRQDNKDSNDNLNFNWVTHIDVECDCGKFETLTTYSHINCTQCGETKELLIAKIGTHPMAVSNNYIKEKIEENILSIEVLAVLLDYNNIRYSATEDSVIIHFTSQSNTEFYYLRFTLDDTRNVIGAYYSIGKKFQDWNISNESEDILKMLEEFKNKL